MRKLIAISAISMLAATSCGGGMLDPKGPNAEIVSDLWWFMFWISVGVFALVLLFMGLAMVKGLGLRMDFLWGSNERTFVLAGGLVLPAITFIILNFLTVTAGRDITELDTRSGDPLEISVVGNQWWWNVTYTESGVVTANEIHIPVDRPVRLTLTSDDVIHSFWIPQLGGKTDLVPGRVNTALIEASEPGEYRGQCAEFCGLGHARMALFVIAQPQEEFQAWLDQQAAPAGEVDEGLLLQGQQVFLGSSCVYCHAVRGTSATGEIGPDLTHIASRQTLAAGTIENNRGNLSRWIVNPQSVKPGTQMPASSFSGEELNALLEYLESLE